jgi:hypothetical protein
MPGVAMHVLNTNHFLVGVDAHKNFPPPLLPFLPHVVVWAVGASQDINFMWSTANTSKASSPESRVSHPVRADSGYTIGRTHDAGPHPAHVMINALLPIIMLGSASKHEFGSSSVTVPGGSDMAIGIAYVMNINLDCADFPCPATPTGFSICASSTVYAGFTRGALIRGLLQYVVDMALAWLIAGACSVGGNALSGGGIRRAISEAMRWQIGGFRQVFRPVSAAATREAARNAGRLRNWLLPHVVGSPLGNSGIPLPGAPDAHGQSDTMWGGGAYSGAPNRDRSAGSTVDRGVNRSASWLDGLFR